VIATAIGEKGQVTLPREIRKAAELEIGDRVEWEVLNGEIRGRKLVRQSSPKRVVARLVSRKGRLFLDVPKGLKISPEAIAQAVREERDGR